MIAWSGARYAADGVGPNPLYQTTVGKYTRPVSPPVGLALTPLPLTEVPLLGSACRPAPSPRYRASVSRSTTRTYSPNSAAQASPNIS